MPAPTQAQIDSFNNIGIAKELLTSFAKRFAEQDLDQLYANCARWKNTRLFEVITTEWELLCLTGNVALISAHKPNIVQIKGNPVCLIGTSGSLAAVTWAVENMRYLGTQTWGAGRNLLNIVAVNGTVPVVKYVLQQYPELRGTVDNQGANALHYAVNYNSFAVIEYLLRTCPELKNGRDRQGCYPLHYAAAVNSVASVKCLLEASPDLRESKASSDGLNILHRAAKFNSSIAVIEYILQTCPELRDSREDNTGASLLQSAACYNSVPIIEYILQTCPELRAARDNDGRNFMHYAAHNHSTPVIEYVLQTFPELRENRDNYGRDSAFYIVVNNSIANIEYVFQAYPALKGNKYKLGANLALYAALYNRVDALEFFLKKFPELVEATDDYGSNLLHYAAMCEKVESVNFLITRYPQLTAKLWVADHNGNTPDAYAIEYHPTIQRTPTQILHDILVDALAAIAANDFKLSDNEKHVAVLRAFPAQVAKILMDRFSFEQIVAIRNCNTEVNELIRKLGINVRVKLREIAEKTNGHPIFAETLETILNIVMAKDSPIATNDELENKLRLPFIFELKKFLRKLEEKGYNKQLSEAEIYTLKVIIDDYDRSTIRHDVANDVIAILQSTQQISALYPKPKLMQMEIQPNNFAVHMPIIRDSLLPNSEVFFIVNGIQHIIDNKDIIIEFVDKNFGKTYFIDQGLPLHTDHTAVNKDGLFLPNRHIEEDDLALDPAERLAGKKPDLVEYGKTLDRIVVDFIAAFYIAREVGRQQQYFDKLMNGLCLEGRIRNAYTWAAEISAILSFNDLMAVFYKEYISYQKVMNGTNDADLYSLSAATRFISEHHSDLPCIVDSNYAPQGEVTSDGVQKYLIEVLGYDLTEQELLGSPEPKAASPAEPEEAPEPMIVDFACRIL